jgi:hypothetical protein
VVNDSEAQKTVVPDVSSSNSSQHEPDSRDEGWRCLLVIVRKFVIEPLEVATPLELFGDIAVPRAMMSRPFRNGMSASAFIPAFAKTVGNIFV